MKRIRIVGLCLVAAFALSAGAAGSASAELWPLYVPLAGKTFPIKYHGLVTQQTRLQTFNNEVKCQKVHVEGQILGSHLTSTHYLFLECTEGLGNSCTSSGAAAGDILLQANEHLGLIQDLFGSSHLVGVRVLVPSSFSFICDGTVTVTVEGSVIGQIVSQVGVQSHEVHLLYSIRKAGEPLFTYFVSPLVANEDALLYTKVGSGGREISSEEGLSLILLLPATETVAIKLQ